MITAVGNVIVIGSIKGSVEAGCMGNDNAYIFALDFKPTDVEFQKLTAILMNLIRRIPKILKRHI